MIKIECPHCYTLNEFHDPDVLPWGEGEETIQTCRACLNTYIVVAEATIEHIPIEICQKCQEKLDDCLCDEEE